MKYAITYTQKFVLGSLLEGLTYDVVEKDITLDQALPLVKWCREHKDVPVKACAGSDYTISSYDVAITEL